MEYDLFNQTDPQRYISDYIEPLLGKQWASVINTQVLLQLDDIMEEAYRLEKHTKICPSRMDVFRPFKEVSPNDVKVVILGKCPYPDNNCDGLAFSCKVSPSPSLKKIYGAILEDKGIDKLHYDQFNFPLDLTYWCDQGILLLNSKLTVIYGKADSHSNIGWQSFISGVLKSIYLKNKDVIFCAWGNDAQSCIKGFTPKYYLSCDNPANAAKMKTKWNCNHFSTINKILISQGKPPLRWLIPK